MQVTSGLQAAATALEAVPTKATQICFDQNLIKI
jgi:hypothetical protein